MNFYFNSGSPFLDFCILRLLNQTLRVHQKAAQGIDERCRLISVDHTMVQPHKQGSLFTHDDFVIHNDRPLFSSSHGDGDTVSIQRERRRFMGNQGRCTGEPQIIDECPGMIQSLLPGPDGGGPKPVASRESNF